MILKGKLSTGYPQICQQCCPEKGSVVFLQQRTKWPYIVYENSIVNGATSRDGLTTQPTTNTYPGPKRCLR